MSKLFKSKLFLGSFVLATMLVGVVAVFANPASAACTISGTLRKGSVGSSVVCLQETLGGLTADGHYGPLTAAAVTNFQENEGLKADAIAGPLTTQALVNTHPDAVVTTGGPGAKSPTLASSLTLTYGVSPTLASNPTNPTVSCSVNTTGVSGAPSVPCDPSPFTVSTTGSLIVLTEHTVTGSGYTFANWTSETSGFTCTTEGNNTSPTCTFILGSNMTVTGNFTSSQTGGTNPTLTFPVTTNVNNSPSSTVGGTVVCTIANISTPCNPSAPNTIPGTSPASIPAGTSVTLTATPTSGFTFGGWNTPICTSANTTNTSTNATCTFTINSNTSIPLTFSSSSSTNTPLTLIFIASTAANVPNPSVVGIVTCASGCNAVLSTNGNNMPITTTINQGTQVKLSANVPATSLQFLGWSGVTCTGVGESSISPSCTFAPTANTSVTAGFIYNPSGVPPTNPTLNYSASNGGNVSCMVGSSPCPQSGASFPSSTQQVTLTANPNSTFIFSGWNNASLCPNTNVSTCTFTLNSANSGASIMANFISSQTGGTNPKLTFGSLPANGGNVTCSNGCGSSPNGVTGVNIVPGTVVTLMASASTTSVPAYTFGFWSITCDANVSTTPTTSATPATTCMFHMPSTTTSVTANFNPQTGSGNPGGTTTKTITISKIGAANTNGLVTCDIVMSGAVDAGFLNCPGYSSSDPYNLSMTGSYAVGSHVKMSASETFSTTNGATIGWTLPPGTVADVGSCLGGSTKSGPITCGFTVASTMTASSTISVSFVTNTAPSGTPPLNPGSGTGTLGVKVCDDKNGNGQCDSGEPYFEDASAPVSCGNVHETQSGISINYSGSTAPVLLNQCASSGDPAYLNATASSGNYTVTVTPPSGWMVSGSEILNSNLANQFNFSSNTNPVVSVPATTSSSVGYGIAVFAMKNANAGTTPLNSPGSTFIMGVTSTPNGGTVSCVAGGSPCAAGWNTTSGGNLPMNTLITLTATPNTALGYTFSQWNNVACNSGVYTSPTCSFTVYGTNTTNISNTAVYASFVSGGIPGGAANAPTISLTVNGGSSATLHGHTTQPSNKSDGDGVNYTWNATGATYVDETFSGTFDSSNAASGITAGMSAIGGVSTLGYCGVPDSDNSGNNSWLEGPSFVSGSSSGNSLSGLGIYGHLSTSGVYDHSTSNVPSKFSIVDWLGNVQSTTNGTTYSIGYGLGEVEALCPVGRTYTYKMTAINSYNGQSASATVTIKIPAYVAPAIPQPATQPGYDSLGNPIVAPTNYASFCAANPYASANATLSCNTTDQNVIANTFHYQDCSLGKQYNGVTIVASNQYACTQANAAGLASESNWQQSCEYCAAYAPSSTSPTTPAYIPGQCASGFVNTPNACSDGSTLRSNGTCLTGIPVNTNATECSAGYPGPLQNCNLQGTGCNWTCIGNNPQYYNNTAQCRN